MKAIVALTFAPGTSDRERTHLLARARAALELFADAKPVEVVSGADRVLVTDAGPGDVTKGDDRLAVVLTVGSILDDGSVVDGTRLLRDSITTRAVPWERIVPPFAAVIRWSRDDPLVAVTDTCGVRHLFYWQGNGVAAVASSAVVLGALADAGLDEDAIAAWALGGMYMGERTAHRGVQKLLAGSLARLSNGRVQISRYCEHPLVVPRRGESRAEAVDGCVHALTEAVAACLSLHSHVTLELSAGMDTRAVLVAAPPAARGGIEAVTLTTSDGTDEETARQIAALLGLPHRVVDCFAIAALPPHEVETLVRTAAKRRGFAANPLAGCVMDFAEARFPTGPRLTGTNGEFGGDAFSGVPVSLREGLPARWRLTDAATDVIVTAFYLTNFRIDEGLVAPDFLPGGRSYARPLLHQAVGRAERWGAGLDEWYLDMRIQNWAGSQFSVTSGERTILAPFLHPAYLRWARGTRSRYKNSKRALAGAIARLNPMLAKIPVNHRFTPEELARHGLETELRRLSAVVRRGEKKLRQRIARREKPTPGAGDLTPLVSQAWATQSDVLQRLRDLPFIQSTVVEDIVSGRRPVASASMAFLLNLDGLLEFRDAVANA